MKDRWEEGKSDEARYPLPVGLTGRPLRVELSQARTSANPRAAHARQV